jgi:hypothetical protein
VPPIPASGISLASTDIAHRRAAMPSLRLGMVSRQVHGAPCQVRARVRSRRPGGLAT